MIYLFYGSDSAKVRAKAFEWVAASRAKVPEAAYVRLAAEDTTPAALEEAGNTSGLFFKKLLVLIDDPFSLKDTGEAVLDALPMLLESPNPIAILAPKLSVANIKKLEPKAEKKFKYDLAVKKETRGFNIALVNALGAKNKEVLWVEIQRALRQGDVPEMIHGLLHWKARSMMEKGNRSWSESEARALSVGLIELLSDARSQSLDLGVALERWAVSLR